MGYQALSDWAQAENAAATQKLADMKRSMNAVEVIYDEYADTTTVSLAFVPAPDSFGPVVDARTTVPGKHAGPVPASCEARLYVLSEGVYEWAMICDGERTVLEMNDYGQFAIGCDGLRAMAESADVRVRVGAYDGPLSPDAKAAIAEYLRMFR